MSTLSLIVEFIVGVYYPMWFRAKIGHNWLEGPRHVLAQVKLTQLQDEKVQAAVIPHIKSSCWFAHSEMILQTMISSEDETERRFAIKKILEIRGDQEVGDSDVRPRKNPDLNMSATSLTDLIPWESTRLFEPPLTCGLAREEVISFLDAPMPVQYMPCHGQCIERVVKEVTRASVEVHGQEKRDGFIRASAAQRKMVPVRNSKKDFTNMTLS